MGGGVLVTALDLQVLAQYADAFRRSAKETPEKAPHLNFFAESLEQEISLVLERQARVAVLRENPHAVFDLGPLDIHGGDEGA